MNICFCLWRWRLFSQTIREGEIIHATVREIAYVSVPDKDREEQERVRGIIYSPLSLTLLCLESLTLIQFLELIVIMQ